MAPALFEVEHPQRIETESRSGEIDHGRVGDVAKRLCPLAVSARVENVDFAAAQHHLNRGELDAVGLSRTGVADDGQARVALALCAAFGVVQDETAPQRVLVLCQGCAARVADSGGDQRGESTPQVRRCGVAVLVEVRMFFAAGVERQPQLGLRAAPAAYRDLGLVELVTHLLDCVLADLQRGCADGDQCRDIEFALAGVALDLGVVFAGVF